jgi:hypothetical protein
VERYAISVWQLTCDQAIVAQVILFVVRYEILSWDGCQMANINIYEAILVSYLNGVMHKNRYKNQTKIMFLCFAVLKYAL